MNLYGGKLLRNRIRQMQDARVETRDAIVWSVNTTKRLCQVKIQGSNQLIYAHFPVNWEQIPVFLKPGNAVRICHTSGQRGRIEILGHGQIVPTPIPGQQATPTIPGLGDAIYTGCNLIPKTNIPGMYVMIGTGTYRIAGTVYTLAAIGMSESTNFAMGEGGKMGDIAESLAIDPLATPTKYRYDSIVIGADGVCDVIKGTEFAYDADPVPEPPEAPAHHIRAGFVLLYPGLTAITQECLNKRYAAPIPTVLEAVVADGLLDLGELPPELSTTITIGVRDQYGNHIVRSGEGYYVEIKWQSGNGTLSYGDQQASGPDHPLCFYLKEATATVTYTRLCDETINPNTDISPRFNIVAHLDYELTAFNFIQLYDTNGDLKV